MKLRLALAQYPIEKLESLRAFEEKLERWVREAAEKRAQLLVFPEYGAMELVSLLPEAVRQDLHASLDAMQPFFEPFDRLHRELARRFGVHILASSFPLKRRNTAMLYAPSGKSGGQEKRIMTRFERENWGIEAGEELRLFETSLGRIGVTICYDSEFPLPARALCEAGAELILVPSCTDAPSGHARVNIAARARALENQCYVAQAPLVGEAPWSAATDVNIGAAGLYGPPDLGFPEDGIVAQGRMNEPGWVHAEADLSAVARVRAQGQVLNHRHWREQGVIPLPAVTRLSLI